MQNLSLEIDRVAMETGFSGVVHVEREGGPQHVRAYGLADRAHGVPCTIGTRFGIASGTKGITALTVMSLVCDGTLSLSTRARVLLGDDLPLIDDAVTIEHLLSHRSGIGDYLDEDTIPDTSEFFPPVPAQRLASSEDYLAVLDGYPVVSVPGERFAYNNGGYVVLALLAERASGTPFHELVIDRVCAPAGMTSTEFLRSDELPGDAAIGYIEGEGLRTNVFHLPVRGSGDGGIFTTVGDVSSLWTALFAGRILPREVVGEMLRVHTEHAMGSMGYGLGFWLRPDGSAELHGYDAGVSFRTRHHPTAHTTETVVSNTVGGTGPVEALLDERT